MARRSKIPGPKQSANVSADEMRAAIPRIERRIDDLKKFDVSSVHARSDPRIKALEASIDRTLVSIFGADSVEYERYRLAKNLDTAGLNLYGGPPLSEVLEGLEKGKERAITLLKGIVAWFREELDDLGEALGGQAFGAYEGLSLHPVIDQASGQRFKDGHYADAIEAACKALNNLVQNKSGRLDLDGTDLMRTVFSPKKPIVAFNPLRDKTDEVEQEGMMHLFEGAIMALRNPRAHKLIEDDPEKGLEFIAFVSLLAKLLDDARKT